jgi:hypothetical protein
MAKAKVGQTTIDGKVSHHVSFGARDTDLEEELQLRDEVYVLVRGHVKTTDLQTGGKQGLNVTVVPDSVDFITKDAYVATMGHGWETPDS